MNAKEAVQNYERRAKDFLEQSKLRTYNQKTPSPSLDMHSPDGHHYKCPWIEDSITVHSDGNVSCGLDDPHSLRTFGNVETQTVQDIFSNPEFDNLQQKLWDGYRCKDCSLYTRVVTDESSQPSLRLKLPTTLIIEPTVKCNIRCLNDSCFANNDASIRTRNSDMLTFDSFTSIIDQVESDLKFVYFLNYGDPFVNTAAENMLIYLREKCQDVEVVTSTNGIPLAKEGRAEKVARSEVDTIVFTIGGISQEAYEKYHVRGKLDVALNGLKNVVEAKKKIGNVRTKVVWRYLAFRWNDTVKEIDDAIYLADKIGVDAFQLYLTHVPHYGSSYRLAPGTPNYQRYRHFIDCALGYTRLAGIVNSDPNGLFPNERVEDLGEARWTSYVANLDLKIRKNTVHFSLSTNRPSLHNASTKVYIELPWLKCKTEVRFKQWATLQFKVPTSYLGRSVTVRITNPNYWFPVDEFHNEDYRCLGVLVRKEKVWWFEFCKKLISKTSCRFEELNEADKQEISNLLPETAHVGLKDDTKGGRMPANS